MRLVVLGTGGMAKSHVEGFTGIEGVEIVAGVDTNTDNLARFCDTHDIDHRFTTLQDAITWGKFDAACNVTPDGAHYPTTMELLAAGKHVFCEKPLATNHAHAEEMAHAAQTGRLVNMVNLTYRNVPALQKAREVISSGVLGDIRHFEASYLQSWLTQSAWGEWDKEHQWLWRLSTAHGSHGVLGDIGIHILDFACYASGLNITEVSARLKTFDKAPGNRIDDYVLDANDSFTMQVATDADAIGVVHASRFASGHLNELRLRLYGTHGGLNVTNNGETGTLSLCKSPDLATATWQDIPLEPVRTNYQKFASAVMSGGPQDPDFAHAARLQAVLDGARASDEAKGAAQIIPAH